jgi:hypothetical protein
MSSGHETAWLHVDADNARAVGVDFYWDALCGRVGEMIESGEVFTPSLQCSSVGLLNGVERLRVTWLMTNAGERAEEAQ